MMTTVHTITRKANVTDSRVYFRRPDTDEIYCVLSMDSVRELRAKKKLEAHLKEQRESGVIIRIREK